MSVFLLLAMYTYGAICLVSGWYLRGAYDKEKRNKAKRERWKNEDYS